MARDRKRAKQRRERGGAAAAGRGRRATRRAPPSRRERPAERGSSRADVPGALDHASADVDEFDAALVRGAGGVPAEPDDAVRG